MHSRLLSEDSMPMGGISTKTSNDNDEKLLAILDDSSKLSDALLLASEHGDLGRVRLLVGRGRGIVDLNRIRGLKLYTPLHHACNRGHLHVSQELIAYGHYPDATNAAQETPLHLAAYSGHLTILDLLLDKGASVDVANEFGETALFYAARRGYPAVVRLLLQRGADSTLRSRFGDRAIEECPNDRTRQAFQPGAVDPAVDPCLPAPAASAAPAPALAPALAPAPAPGSVAASAPIYHDELVLSILRFADATTLSRAGAYGGVEFAYRAANHVLPVVLCATLHTYVRVRVRVCALRNITHIRHVAAAGDGAGTSMHGQKDTERRSRLLFEVVSRSLRAGVTTDFAPHWYCMHSVLHVGRGAGSAACVHDCWHRVAENDVLWQALGVRKWELALSSTLGGMGPADRAACAGSALAQASFIASYRPPSSSSRSRRRGSGDQSDSSGSRGGDSRHGGRDSSIGVRAAAGRRQRLAAPAAPSAPAAPGSRSAGDSGWLDSKTATATTAARGAMDQTPTTTVADPATVDDGIAILGRPSSASGAMDVRGGAAGCGHSGPRRSGSTRRPYRGRGSTGLVLAGGPASLVPGGGGGGGMRGFPSGFGPGEGNGRSSVGTGGVVVGPGGVVRLVEGRARGKRLAGGGGKTGRPHGQPHAPVSPAQRNRSSLLSSAAAAMQLPVELLAGEGGLDHHARKTSEHKCGGPAEDSDEHEDAV